jgi:hypothetical protein
MSDEDDKTKIPRVTDTRERDIIAEQVKKRDTAANNEGDLDQPFSRRSSSQAILQQLREAAPSIPMLDDIYASVKDVLGKMTLNGHPIAISGSDLQVDASAFRKSGSFSDSPPAINIFESGSNILMQNSGAVLFSGPHGVELPAIPSISIPSPAFSTPPPIDAAVVPSVLTPSTGSPSISIDSEQPFNRSELAEVPLPQIQASIVPSETGEPGVSPTSSVGEVVLQTGDSSTSNTPTSQPEESGSQSFPPSPTEIVGAPPEDSGGNLSMPEPPVSEDEPHRAPADSNSGGQGFDGVGQGQSLTDKSELLGAVARSRKAGSRAATALFRTVLSSEKIYSVLDTSGKVSSATDPLVPTFPFLDWSGSINSGFNVWFGKPAEADVYTVSHYKDASKQIFTQSDVSGTAKLYGQNTRDRWFMLEANGSSSALHGVGGSDSNFLLKADSVGSSLAVSKGGGISFISDKEITVTGSGGDWGSLKPGYLGIQDTTGKKMELEPTQIEFTDGANTGKLSAYSTEIKEGAKSGVLDANYLTMTNGGDWAFIDSAQLSIGSSSGNAVYEAIQLTLTSSTGQSYLSTAALQVEVGTYTGVYEAEQLTLSGITGSSYLSTTALHLNTGSGPAIKSGTYEPHQLTITDPANGQAFLTPYLLQLNDGDKQASYEPHELTLSNPLTGEAFLTPHLLQLNANGKQGSYEPHQLTLTTGQGAGANVFINVPTNGGTEVSAFWQEIEVCVEGSTMKMKVLGTEPY